MANINREASWGQRRADDSQRGSRDVRKVSGLQHHTRAGVTHYEQRGKAATERGYKRRKWECRYGVEQQSSSRIRLDQGENMDRYDSRHLQEEDGPQVKYEAVTEEA